MFDLKHETFNIGGKKSTSIRFDSIWAEKIHPSRETKVQARTQKWKKKGSRGTGICFGGFGTVFADCLPFFQIVMQGYLMINHGFAPSVGKPQSSS